MHFYQTWICATGARHNKEYGAAFLKNSVFAGCCILSRVCINSRPSRRPSVKVVNQNGSLGEKAAEYYLKPSYITHLKTQLFPLHVIYTYQ